MTNAEKAAVSGSKRELIEILSSRKLIGYDGPASRFDPRIILHKFTNSQRVEYQWKTEIEKFTDLPAQVIEGLLPRRPELYSSPAFFNLSSYELVLKDVRYMHELARDLIILDEAQRIRVSVLVPHDILRQQAGAATTLSRPPSRT